MKYTVHVHTEKGHESFEVESTAPGELYEKVYKALGERYSGMTIRMPYVVSNPREVVAMSMPVKNGPTQELKGTYCCPICSRGEPHSHTEIQIEEYLNTQRERFGQMMNEKEVFMQCIETLSEIARSTETQAKRLFREVERMFDEYLKRWPKNQAEGTAKEATKCLF